MNNPALILKSLDYNPGVIYSNGIYIGIYKNLYLIFIKIHHKSSNNNITCRPNKDELEFILKISKTLDLGLYTVINDKHETFELLLTRIYE